MGNLLWQQEAAEFIEQYPQRRGSQAVPSLLRPSVSAGTLCRKPDSVMPILNKRASGGELLTTQQRHQRDLFSGDLGIPDVNSHVGSMVHTFENMALKRNFVERQRDQREREHSKYIAELMALHAAAEKEAEQTTAAAIVATTTTTKRTFIPASGTHTNNSKFQQLKKKTQETRQKIIQQILQNHPMHKDVTKLQDTSRLVKGARQAAFNSEVYYRNIDEDYRKNLFGSVTNRGERDPEPEVDNSDVETSSFCDEIVTQAFDEIFEGYSGLEDEEGVQERNQPEALIADLAKTLSASKNYSCPKKLPRLTVPKKTAAPPPPSSCCSSSHQAKRKPMPLKENKQRSFNLNNFFERLKTPSKKIVTPPKFNKTSSKSLITTATGFPNTSNCSGVLNIFPADSHLRREVEGQESSEKLDQDFLRGSTVSQSFVRHLKTHKLTKGRAPPVPPATKRATKQLKTSEALRQVLLFPKKSRYPSELIPDNSTNIETRKYYRHLDDDAMTKAEHRVPERRKADGCSGLANTKSFKSPVVEI